MPNRGAGAADTNDEGVGEGGENKGPVQKHLTSLRVQEGRFASHDLGSVVLPSHKLQGSPSHSPGPVFLGILSRGNKYTCNPLRETLHLPLLWVRGAHSHPGCTDLGRPPRSFARSSVKLPSACLGMVCWAFRGHGSPTPESWINVELGDEKSSPNLRSAPKTAWLLTTHHTTYYHVILLILSYYCCPAKLKTALRLPASGASHALKGLRGFPGCEAEKLPTV